MKYQFPLKKKKKLNVHEIERCDEIERGNDDTEKEAEKERGDEIERG